MGAWGMGVVEYQCKGCGAAIDVISDDLPSYDVLIIGWHKKAVGSEDYFSKYVFEYLAFIAYIKSYVALDVNSDRRAIQKLKRDRALEGKYLGRIKEDDVLLKHWAALIDELKRQPLHNSSRDYDYPEIDEWWNTTGDRIDKKSKLRKGVIHSLSDWQNMVEFWYGTRNNLFHGGKDPNIKRDMFLVEHAFKTLNAFMTIVLGGLR